MHTTASKKPGANGSDRASAWSGNTPSATPASRMRSRFSDALNHRSVAHTCTPNSRRRKIDDAARPQPRSSTRMPGFRSSALESHSVNQSELAPPLALARIQSGWYCDDRGNCSEMRRLSELTWFSIAVRHDCDSRPLLHHQERHTRSEYYSHQALTTVLIERDRRSTILFPSLRVASSYSS